MTVNRLDRFPAWLLERCQYARARGIFHFKLTHPNGDELRVNLTFPDGVEVIRHPQVPVPGPVGIRGFKPEAMPRMRLAITERELARDVVQGITSYNAQEWRG